MQLAATIHFYEIFITVSNRMSLFIFIFFTTGIQWPLIRAQCPRTQQQEKPYAPNGMASTNSIDTFVV